MGFWAILEVASMPILQVLLITLLGAFLATDYLNLLSPDARRSLNKLVFIVFTPSLIFANLAKTVTLQDIISWWFMPVNIGLTYLIGGIIGWVAVKLLKAEPHLEGLIIATCSSGNLGNLLLILIPAICKEKNNPFGDNDVCSSIGISYASFSMAIGSVFKYTCTYQLLRWSAMSYKALLINVDKRNTMEPNQDLGANVNSHLLEPRESHNITAVVQESGFPEDYISINNSGLVRDSEDKHVPVWHRLFDVFYKVVQEALAPPTLGAIFGIVFGMIPWLKRLLIGDGAPLQLIYNSLNLLGEATIPCIILILGGNLTQSSRDGKVPSRLLIMVVCVRFVLLPAIGIGIVTVAKHLGFLPPDPLYQFVLMIQFAVPPAINISTIVQLFNVAQVECSVIMLWTYMTAVVSLTAWSTVFLWILS